MSNGEQQNSELKIESSEPSELGLTEVENAQDLDRTAKKLLVFIERLVKFGLLYPVFLSLVIHAIVLLVQIVPSVHLLKDPERRGELYTAAKNSIEGVYNNSSLEELIVATLDRFDAGKPIGLSATLLVLFGTAIDNPFVDLNQFFTEQAIQDVYLEWSILDAAEVTKEAIEWPLSIQMHFLDTAFPAIAELTTTTTPMAYSREFFQEVNEGGFGSFIGPKVERSVNYTQGLQEHPSTEIHWEEYYTGLSDELADIFGVRLTKPNQEVQQAMALTADELSQDWGISEELSPLLLSTLNTKSNWLTGYYGSVSELQFDLVASRQLLDWYLTTYGDYFTSPEEAGLFLSVGVHTIRYNGVITEAELQHQLAIMTTVYQDTLETFSTANYQTPDRFTVYTVLLDTYLRLEAVSSLEIFNNFYPSFEQGDRNGESELLITPVDAVSSLPFNVFSAEDISTLQPNQLAATMPWNFFLRDGQTRRNLIEPAASINPETGELTLTGFSSEGEIDWSAYYQVPMFFTYSDGRGFRLQTLADQVGNLDSLNSETVLAALEADGVTSFFTPNLFINPRLDEPYISTDGLNREQLTLMAVTEDDQGAQHLYLILAQPTSGGMIANSIRHSHVEELITTSLAGTNQHLVGVVLGDPGYGVYGKSPDGTPRHLTGLSEGATPRLIFTLPSLGNDHASQNNE